MQYSTKIIRNRPSEFVNRILWRTAYSWLWILIIPVAVAGIVALYRWQWIVVGLAFLFLVYPIILSTIYFKYALSEGCVKFIKPLILSFDDKAIKIQYVRELSEGIEIIKEVETRFTDLESYSPGNESIVIWFKNPRNSSLRINDNEWNAGLDAKMHLLRLFERCDIQMA